MFAGDEVPAESLADQSPRDFWLRSARGFELTLDLDGELFLWILSSGLVLDQPEKLLDRLRDSGMALPELLTGDKVGF